MVKSPKVRHSKQRTEPVTIDLSADDVKRDDAKAAGAADDKKPAAKPASSSAADTGKASAQPSSSAASKAGASGAKSAFGRDGSGKAEPAKKNEPKPGEQKAGETKASDATAKDEPKAKLAAPATPPRRGGIGALAAGLVGGAVALAGAGGLYLGGYLPMPQPPATDNSAIERLETELASLRDEITALQAAPPAGGGGGEELGGALAETNTRVENMAVLVEEMRAELSSLSDVVASGGGGDEAALATLRDRLSQIEQTVAQLPADGGGDVQAVTEQVSGLSGQLSAMQDELDGLTSATQERFAALDASLAQLAKQLEEQGNDPGVALAIAASALKAAIDRGQPFGPELETFARLAPDAPEIAALRELAATGVPTAAAIAAETDSAARAIIAAEQPDNANAGLLDRLWASAESLITVRPIGAAEGEDVPAIVARMEVAITNGDYAGAIAEYEGLPESAKAAGAGFIAKVKARSAADELVAKVLADALRA